MTTSAVNCYFNESGYYIQSGDNKVCRRVSKKGDTDPLHHTYVVLGAMMSELAGKPLGEPIINVYNDSRLVDDLQGASPIDEFCREFLLRLRRDVFPVVHGTIVFKKASTAAISEAVDSAFAEMFVSDKVRDEALSEAQEVFDTKHRSRVQRLQERWRNGN